MNKFKISETQLQSNLEVSSEITISSFPKPYKVEFKKFVNKFNSNQVVLVDSKIKHLYGVYHDKLIEIEAKEENKNIESVLKVCEKLLEFGFDKGWTLIVIGGGIIQDIGAYTAKTYKRGIKWVYYPTTLLSQCDSCIGGKTALNFKRYKNQLALFSAPEEVYIDIGFLNTLSDKDMLSGHGEIVKLFLIGGEYYIENIDNFSIYDKIFHSLSIKKAVVECDEFENNERKALNYGHSFGHVVESLTDYKIPHGEAVLLGIEIINRLFTKSSNISNLIEKYTSLDTIKNIDINKLVEGLKTDKKVGIGKITFVNVLNPGNTEFLGVQIDQNLTNRVHEIFTY